MAGGGGLAVPRSMASASVLLLVASAAACAGVGAPGDVEPSFAFPSLSQEAAAAVLAPPTREDRERTLESWRARDVVARDVRIEARFELPQARAMLVVSHATHAGRHFGGVLAPADAIDGERTRPVLLSLHGFGPEHGIDLPDPADDEAARPPTEIVTVWPSFGGNDLRFRGQRWHSDGDAWDFCDGAGDDALRMLNAALAAVPGADPRRMVAYGGSRGGTVALLIATRDRRVRRVVSAAGPTDFFAGDLLQHANASVLYANWFLAVRPDASVDVDATRERMLRCSPVHFAELLPPTQLHHGTADQNLPVTQSELLERRLLDLRRLDDAFHYYDGDNHNLEASHAVVVERVRAFAAPVFAEP